MYKAQRVASRAKEDMAVTITRIKDDTARVIIRAAEDQSDAIKARVRSSSSTVDVITAVDAVVYAATIATMEPERQAGTDTTAANREE